jgi:hypothetical protein
VCVAVIKFPYRRCSVFVKVKKCFVMLDKQFVLASYCLIVAFLIIAVNVRAFFIMVDRHFVTFRNSGFLLGTDIVPHPISTLLVIEN